MNDACNRALYAPLRQACAAPSTAWAVQCDFDGTICLTDVADSLLQRFGRPGWEALEEDWEAGRIGSRACMQGQVALLDMSQDELDAHLDRLSIDPGFPAFVAAAERLGVPLQVVSDGLDYAIHRILAVHGLDHLPVLANRLLRTGERSWALECPHGSDACVRASGNCKCARLADVKPVRARQVLFVGDGSSDFCVSGRADHVLAKARLIDHCRERGYPHTPFVQFDEACAMLQQLALPEGACA